MGSSPAKGTFLRGTAYFDVLFCVKVGAGVLAVVIGKKAIKQLRQGVRVIAHAQKRNLLSDPHKILHKIPYKFWLRSVTGFLGGGGSYFPVLHRFSSSPLQHSRAAVRGCDLRSPRGVATVFWLRTFARFVRGRRGVMSHTC